MVGSLEPNRKIELALKIRKLPHVGWIELHSMQ
jgi:hypothetical protein